MTEDDIRAAMRRKFEVMSLREWCRLTGCTPGHVSGFMRGHHGPPSDLLRALNLRVNYVRDYKKRQA